LYRLLTLPVGGHIVSVGTLLTAVEVCSLYHDGMVRIVVTPN
jgi:hypothetical protein